MLVLAADLRARASDATTAATAGGVLLLAVASAFLGGRSLLLGLMLALAPALLLLLSHPRVAAVAGIGLLPFFSDIARGGPVKVSLSDVLLAIAVIAGLFVASRRDWQALRPVLPLLVVYAGLLLVAVMAHLDSNALIDAFQRLQIIIVPLVVGAVVARGGDMHRALGFYVLASSALALVWVFDLHPASLELQKNPVGQFIAGALLVIASDPKRRWLLLQLPLLIYGLLNTESRGSLLGLAVGLVVLVLARPGADKLRTAAVLIPFTIVFLIAYSSLPDDIVERGTTLGAADGSAASASALYNVKIRESYRDDALEIIEQNPLTGVGIANYLAGSLPDGTLTNDPHNVVLLEAAEGGLPLLGGLLALLIGTAALLWRRRRDTPYASIALAVQAAIFAHGLVDVYWVRGTPVLGWVLVGAALADAVRGTRGRQMTGSA